MKLYRLTLVLHESGRTEEGKYVGEIPALPGCRAWGDTAAQALENLQAVATAFIESYQDRGDALPKDVRAVLEPVEPSAVSEMLVAV